MRPLTRPFQLRLRGQSLSAREDDDSEEEREAERLPGGGPWSKKTRNLPSLQCFEGFGLVLGLRKKKPAKGSAFWEGFGLVIALLVQ